MIHAVHEHFKRVDPILHEAARKVSPRLSPETSKNLFRSLCREIIGQQLSGKVADVIFARFKKLFSKKTINAKSVLDIEDQKLRDVGMAWSKVRAVKDLAQKVHAKELLLEPLHTMNEDDAKKELVKVKGIGPWTAEMFLMFSLGRPDVFSFGDLGLKRGIQKLYNMKKEPTEKRMKKLSDKWSPYRTYAACILWELLEYKELP